LNPKPRRKEHPSYMVREIPFGGNWEPPGYMPPRVTGRVEGTTVTIGIGMICGTRQVSHNQPATGAVLMCADTMASFSTTSSNQASGKMYEMPHGFCAAFSDDFAWSQKVILELHKRMRGVDPKSQSIRDEIKLEFCRSFEYAWLWYRGEVLRDKAHVTEDEFLHDVNLAPSVRARARRIWRTECRKIPCQMLLGGQTHHGPLLLYGDYQAVREVSDHQVIGSGSCAAQDWLNFREQNGFMSIQRSFFHMREAKRFSQLSAFVGSKTQYALMIDGQTHLLQERGALMDNWGQEFGIRDTDKLDGAERLVSFETAFSLKL
jgi:hypothetical protein